MSHKHISRVRFSGPLPKADVVDIEYVSYACESGSTPGSATIAEWCNSSTSGLGPDSVGANPASASNLIRE